MSVTESRLTHWGRATHICVANLTIIGSDNGSAPGQRQASIWTNAGILSIGPLGTIFNEISIGIQAFPFKRMHLKMSSGKWCHFVSASMCFYIHWMRFGYVNTSKGNRVHWISFEFQKIASFRYENQLNDIWPSSAGTVCLHMPNRLMILSLQQA